MPFTKIKDSLPPRIKRTRQALADLKLDALIVVHPWDVRYLTGFRGEDSLLVLTDKKIILVTDNRFELQLKKECPRLSFFLRKGKYQKLSNAVAHVLQKSLKPGKKKPPTVGIESTAVTLAQFRTLKKAIGPSLRQSSPIIEKLRVTKDPYEISKIKNAVRVAQQAMTETLSQIKIGISEIELAAILEYNMAKRGSSAPAFKSIVAFGPNAAQPHAIPGNTKLKKSHTILCDWGATVDGYRSDLTRCFVKGRIPPSFKEAYKWVLEAQLAAIAEIRAGASIKTIDQAARNVIKKSKFPIYQHGTGHGLGLEIHESPLLSVHAEGHINEGMVITIEPGVYLPGKFAIRIEDDVLVTATGRKVLSNLPKDTHSLISWKQKK